MKVRSKEEGPAWEGTTRRRGRRVYEINNDGREIRI
jgi:hypothetical protein